MGKVRLTDTVFELLLSRIVSLEYEPGMTLVERDICEELGVSRTPVREASMRLADMGLVTILPRFGTQVSIIDINDIKCAFSIRILLEELAGNEAAKRISKNQLNELENILQETKSIQNGGDYFSADQVVLGSKFHTVIFEASGNHILCDFMEKLLSRCIRALIYALKTNEKVRHDLDYHFQIFSALKKRDAPRSGHLCREHAVNTMKKLSEYLL